MNMNAEDLKDCLSEACCKEIQTPMLRDIQREIEEFEI